MHFIRAILFKLNWIHCLQWAHTETEHARLKYWWKRLDLNKIPFEISEEKKIPIRFFVEIFWQFHYFYLQFVFKLKMWSKVFSNFSTLIEQNWAVSRNILTIQLFIGDVAMVLCIFECEKSLFIALWHWVCDPTRNQTTNSGRVLFPNERWSATEYRNETRLSIDSSASQHKLKWLYTFLSQLTPSLNVQMSIHLLCTKEKENPQFFFIIKETNHFLDV